MIGVAQRNTAIAGYIRFVVTSVLCYLICLKATKGRDLVQSCRADQFFYHTTRSANTFRRQNRQIKQNVKT